VLPLLGLGIWLTVRLAIADAFFRQDTPDSIARAARLESDNAAYHDSLAEYLESEGKNPDAERELAVRLSPREASHWIGLGVRAEVERDYPRAEKYLLQAAKVNLGFEPRWALMNFYFRRGDTRQFSFWARRALDISYGDLTPVFRLCWMATSDPRAIESMIPSAKDTQLKYLQFLLSTKRLDEAGPIAAKLASQADAESLPILLDYCDAAADAHTGAALEVWNALCRRKLEPFEILSPEDGHVVTNGDFRIKPVEHGFDWRIPRVDGVFVTVGASSDGASSTGVAAASAVTAASYGASIEMSGTEPEECLLMAQIVPLSPGHQYRLDYEYRGPESEDDSGLSWELTAPASHAVLAHSEDLPMTGDWAAGHVNFKAGADPAARLSLRYKRALGTVRHEGSLALRKVAIGLVR
jgi:tetratricopeptide (TPR) repeat protein